VTVAAFARRKPARRPLPAQLPRDRIVYPAPSACPCYGGTLREISEDITETLELISRQWKVIQHVRVVTRCFILDRGTDSSIIQSSWRELARRWGSAFNRPLG